MEHVYLLPDTLQLTDSVNYSFVLIFESDGQLKHFAAAQMNYKMIVYNCRWSICSNNLGCLIALKSYQLKPLDLIIKTDTIQPLGYNIKMDFWNAILNHQLKTKIMNTIQQSTGATRFGMRLYIKNEFQDIYLIISCPFPRFTVNQIYSEVVDFENGITNWEQYLCLLGKTIAKYRPAYNIKIDQLP